MDGTPFESLGQTQALVLIAVYAVVIVVSIVVYVTIVRKAGYSGWWVLTAFVPLLNLVMIAVFAFSEWPITRELNAARMALAQQQTHEQGPGYDRFSWG